MRRRQFITLLGGATVTTFPGIARAQQPLPTIGILAAGGPPIARNMAAFQKGLGEIGFVEGRNVAIAMRTTDQYNQLPALTSDLVKLPVAAIYASGAANAALAAKAATATIPIVFANGGDPVKAGLVESFNRPGGNVTGVTFFSASLTAKRLELLRELAPQAALIAFLVNPQSERTEADIADLMAVAGGLGQEIIVVRASVAAELAAAFATIAQRKAGAILVGGDALFGRQPEPIIALAARQSLPAIYANRTAPDAGGLMSYGDDREESHRQAGLYIGRVLKGEKPADLPVLQPTKFEFVINSQAAKALGIMFPSSFYLRANEVIE